MPDQTFTLHVNGKTQTVTCDPSVRVLWVLRDLLGIHGPKYGCGLDVCKACTCHIDTGDGSQIACVAITANPDRRPFRQRASFLRLEPLIELHGTATHKSVRGARHLEGLLGAQSRRAMGRPK